MIENFPQNPTELPDDSALLSGLEKARKEVLKRNFQPIMKRFVGDPGSQMRNWIEFKRELRTSTPELTRHGAGIRMTDSVAGREVWLATNMAGVLFNGGNGGHVASFGGNYEVTYLDEGETYAIGDVPHPDYTHDEFRALESLPLSGTTAAFDNQIDPRARYQV